MGLSAFMDADNITKLGGTGVLSAIGVRFLWNWLSREKQEFSLYKTELAAHEQTKKELESERKLRKDTEMALQEFREYHDKQQEEWDRQRDEDRKSREELKDQVFALKTEVKTLSGRVAELTAARP